VAWSVTRGLRRLHLIFKLLILVSGAALFFILFPYLLRFGAPVYGVLFFLLLSFGILFIIASAPLFLFILDHCYSKRL